MFSFYVLCSLYFILTVAYDKGSHDVDLQVESFQYKDYYFNFYNIEANWDEAFAICKAAFSRLAVVHNMERANFLAETLSYTIVGFEDVWIGGRILVEDWEWVPIKHPLPSEVVEGYPPWLNYPTKRGRYCLSLDRINHTKPIFVDLYCNLQRPFICEKSSSQHLIDKPMPLPLTKIGNTTFSVYYGRVTWDEALTFCKESGSRLATVYNIDTARKLVVTMQHSRPPIRNAWIGARKQNYGWVWISTDELLPEEKDLETGFPPWASATVADKYAFTDCVALDHHSCKKSNPKRCKEQPVFLTESCNLKKDFICETVPPMKREPSNTSEVVMIDSIKYIFSRKRRSWQSAVKVCASLNMELAMPASKRELNNIVSSLADVQFAWDHLWLGAKWKVIQNEWIWLNNRSIAPPSSNKSYLPWCKHTPIHEDYENCLNVDRDSHNIPIVYGFNCSEPQGFVCQFIADEEFPFPQTKYLPNFVIHDYLLSHPDAEEACLYNKSHLAIVNTIQLAKNLSFILPVDTLVWLGGQRVDSVWQWLLTKEIIPDVPNVDDYPPWGFATTTEGKVCLAMQSGYRRHPQFIEMPCSTKLFYVCQIKDEDLPTPDHTIDHNDFAYNFFRQPETWARADRICTSLHMYLPKVGNQELANILSEVTGEKLVWWVGAKKEENSFWQWTSTGEKIPDKIMDASWFGVNGSYKTGTECLVLLDYTYASKFSRKNCDSKYEFICVNDKMQNNDQTIRKQNMQINIAPLSDIENGKKYCSDRKMVPLNMTNDIKMISEIMSRKNIKSAWMNIGRTKSGKWVYLDSEYEFTTNIKFPQRDDGYEQATTKDCAMLIHNNIDRWEIRRSDCNDYSYMLCMKRILPSANKPLPYEMEKNITRAIRIIANLENKTFERGKKFCKELGGDMVELTLYGEGVKFFKALSDDYKYFWIGEALTRKIVDDDVPFENITNFTVSGVPKKIKNMCLAYNKSQNSFHNIDCNEKISTLCFIELRSCKPLPQLKNLEWIPERCTSGYLASGKVCTAKCTYGVIFGPKKLVCLKGNWSSRSTPVNIPICVDNMNQSQNLLRFLTSKVVIVNKPRPPFIFVLDAGVSDLLFEITVGVVKRMVNIILLNQERKAAVILYSKQSQTALDLQKYYTCDFTEKLKSLPKAEHILLPNYYKALESAASMIYRNTLKNAFLVFFALRADAGPTVEKNIIIKRLQKSGVTIIVIAANNKLDRNNLDGLASIRNKELYLYWFHNITALQECEHFLNLHKNITPDTCDLERKNNIYN